MERQEHIGPQIKRLNAAFYQAANSAARRSGLTGTQAFVLGHLARQEGALCARDLEQCFGLRHPTVSGILQRLEGRGMIACTPDARDHRCKRIAVTPAGLQSVQQAEQALDAVEQAALGGFSPAQRAEFRQLLDQAIAALDAANAGHGEDSL